VNSSEGTTNNEDVANVLSLDYIHTIYNILFGTSEVSIFF